MAILNVENIGPVKSSGELKFEGVTLFIGDQGTGKSTLAKVFSTLSWIEKALVRGDFRPEVLSNQFLSHLKFQGIDTYLKNESNIKYIGDAYKFYYENKRFEAVKNQNSKTEYDFPKIMYVPSERNFVSTIDRPDLIKRLPHPIFSFLEEYEYAKQTLPKSIKLPIDDIKFEYQLEEKQSQLIGKDYDGKKYTINLLDASSGYQSLVPLFLVTESLSRIISTEKNEKHNELSVYQEIKLKDVLYKIIKNPNLTEEEKNIQISKKIRPIYYTSFINIVEEPEQNLFPTSQKQMLYALLNSKNKNPNNKLIITTHSPYIINYLTLSVKAFQIQNEIDKTRKSELSKIVQTGSRLDPQHLHLYQIENGVVSELESYKGLPSDENYLNNLLADFNNEFIQLLNIEEQ